MEVLTGSKEDLKPAPLIAVKEPDRLVNTNFSHSLLAAQQML